MARAGKPREKWHRQPRQVAREYSLQRFPDEPITLVRGEALPGFDGTLYRAPAGKNGWVFFIIALSSLLAA